MIKLLKNMRRKEKLMALLCLLFVVVQVYFDLRLRSAHLRRPFCVALFF